MICRAWFVGTLGVLHMDMMHPSRLVSGHFNLAQAWDELPASVTRQFLETAYSTAFLISLLG
jgi:hypothetical protein